jgi:ribonuclease BN (tRNA processing enzyme)
LTPDLAGRIAAQAQCNHLVLTHFYPECDPRECSRAAAEHFDGTITAAHDLLKINI